VVPPARDPAPPAEGLGFLDQQPPEREGRDITERAGGGAYPRGGSGYDARWRLQNRRRFPVDTTGAERRAVWVLLNLARHEEDYHAKHGRYAAFNEILPVRGVGAKSFARHNYRFELETSADGFKIDAVPLSAGLRPLYTDEGGMVDYPDE
jgi:hypothetical protein